jgi:NADH:ubiquinone oxidoreductase subunit 3 (subunit A)
LFFAALTVALVLGYLFLNKLVDISREEDCGLAHRYNCGAVEVPNNRQ